MTAARLSTILKNAAKLAKEGLVVDVLPDGTIRVRQAIKGDDDGDEFASVSMKK